MYTLVVIDMQPKFTTTHNEVVIKACQREINLAIRRKAGIIFLEFDGYGDTIPELKNLITGYSKAYFKTKCHNSGAVEVAEVIARHNLYHNVRVIGVNTSYCVYETVEGLQNYHGKVTVVADACNCFSHPFGINKLKELKIKIINNKNKIDTEHPSW